MWVVRCLTLVTTVLYIRLAPMAATLLGIVAQDESLTTELFASWRSTWDSVA